MTPIRPEAAGLRPLTPIEALLPLVPLADAREEAAHRFAQLALGQPVTGKVLSRFDDGSFLVRIADAAARMSLPAGTQIGDSLALTLASRQPRLTFLLGADAGSTPTTLSTTARPIDSVLHSAQQNAALTGKAPIMDMTAPDAPIPATAPIAAALRDTLTTSGLFYESHLREWAAGTRTLAELAREPQAQLANPGQPGAAAGRADAPGNELTQLINQQLNTLEQHRVVWRGEAWPGQPMEWEVAEESPEGEARGLPQTWRSEVRFELPALGTVTATLRLTGERLQVRIGTDNAAATASLRTRGHEFSQALEAAGIPLSALMVKQHEST